MVETMHSSGFLKKTQTLAGARKLRVALRHLSAVTAPSRELCQAVNSLGLRTPPCVYIPNGFDAEVFRPAASPLVSGSSFGLPQDRPVILCGSVPRCLVPKKGEGDLASAAAEVLRHSPHVLFVFAGSEDPVQAQQVRQALQASGTIASCRFLEPIPHERMPQLMALPRAARGQRVGRTSGPTKIPWNRGPFGVGRVAKRIVDHLATLLPSARPATADL